jgi:integrase
MRLPSGVKFEPHFLTDEEFHRLLAAMAPQWRPMVLTLAHTGLRWGEVTALTWADVDLWSPYPQLQVRHAWKRAPQGRELGEPKSKRSRRTVGLSGDVVATLRPLQGKPHEYVFAGRGGAAVSHTHWMPRYWRPAVTAAGLENVRIHDLRHSFASWLLTSGHDIYSVSVALGHESIATTTGTYGHIAPSQHALTAAAIGAILARHDEPGDVLDAEVIGVPELEA